MNSIVLVGGGGHAKVIVSILRKLGSFSLLGYTALKAGGDLMGIPFLGTDIEIPQLAVKHGNLNVVLAVGQVGPGHLRSSLWDRLHEFQISFPSIVSPKAIVNEAVSIAEGTVLMDGVVVNSGASLGRGVIANTNSTIEHDVVLGDWVHVAPGATISGGVTIGDFSMIGAGATVIEGKTIGSGCLIGAGATVISDLSEAGVYVGCPARRIKT
jgi:sugar O-acyltransferase (sialic acid O-acetyltransferase NeuD family)